MSNEWTTLVVYFAMFAVVFYLFIVMPRKQQEKKHKNLVDNMSKGDKIVTIGGIKGEIYRIKEDTVVLKINDDGTQMEVANGLLGTGVPQAILPGGTGNAMAHTLGVSINTREAAQLIVNSTKRRAIDLAKIGDQSFMLRAYCGMSAEDAASREQKDRLGQLAYVQAALKFIREVPETHYRATVDGEVIEGEALIVFILNAGSIGGVMGMEIPEVGDVNISDGYLDLYAITKGLKPLRAISKYLFHRENDANLGVYSWKGKEITIEADTEQDVWIDGELGGKTPFTTTVVPQALEIVVPS